MATSLANAAGRSNAHATIAAATTDGALVTGVTGKKIRVHAFIINQGDTTPSTVQFNSKPGGAGTLIYQPLKAAANGAIVAPNIDSGWFETNAGEGLTATTGAGSNTAVGVVYSLVA